MNWTIDLCVSEHRTLPLFVIFNCCDLQLAMMANAGEDIVDSFVHYIMITYSYYYIRFCITRSLSVHMLNKTWLK